MVGRPNRVTDSLFFPRGGTRKGSQNPKENLLVVALNPHFIQIKRLRRCYRRLKCDGGLRRRGGRSSAALIADGQHRRGFRGEKKSCFSFSHLSLFLRCVCRNHKNSDFEAKRPSVEGGSRQLRNCGGGEGERGGGGGGGRMGSLHSFLLASSSSSSPVALLVSLPLSPRPRSLPSCKHSTQPDKHGEICHEFIISEQNAMGSRRRPAGSPLRGREGREGGREETLRRLRRRRPRSLRPPGGREGGREGRTLHRRLLDGSV